MVSMYDACNYVYMPLDGMYCMYVCMCACMCILCILSMYVCMVCVYIVCVVRLYVWHVFYMSFLPLFDYSEHTSFHSSCLQPHSFDIKVTENKKLISEESS